MIDERGLWTAVLEQAILDLVSATLLLSADRELSRRS